MITNKNTTITQHNGVLVLNKPQGPTSAGCLEKIKRGLRQKKIGHAGTLDPMATGVLVVLLGQGTKLAPYLLEGDKVYSGRITLGLTTDTYDIQGTVIEEKGWEGVTPEAVRKVVDSWTGLQEQEVPPVSAAKHKGKPLYALQRAGKDVPVKVKTIEITQAEILDMDLPEFTFRVSCSRGTYIRSLAHSLGKRLGCGAVLTSLTREQSHPFGIDQAHNLEEVLQDPDGFSERIIPLKDSLPDWPQIRLTGEDEKRVRNGGRIEADRPELPDPAEGERAMLLEEAGSPLALVEVIRDGHRLRFSILRGLWT